VPDYIHVPQQADQRCTSENEQAVPLGFPPTPRTRFSGKIERQHHRQTCPYEALQQA